MDSTTRRALADPDIIADAGKAGGIALARRGELLVSPRAAEVFAKELRAVGEPASEGRDGAQLWRLTGGANPFSVTEQLSRGQVEPAEIGPNHVFFGSPLMHGCPAEPPKPARREVKIPPLSECPIEVGVLDSGTIPHPALAGRVTSVQGEWINPATHAFEPVPDDAVDRDGDGTLDMMAGHGNLVCSVIAERSRCARITSIGQRGLFALYTEWEIAHTLRTMGPKFGVINLSIAGMTHRNRPPIGLALALNALPAETAVVASSGNMNTAIPHWPGAFRRVICVGALDDTGGANPPLRASFSNFGAWVDCCCGGVDVLGAHVWWKGGIEDDPTGSYDFEGWSTWSGTSFSAPKVAAAIAQLACDRGIAPRLAAAQLLAGSGGVAARWRSDMGIELALP
jgi:Subtilase family